MVTNTAKYSQYYRPQENAYGRPIVIVRQYVGNIPEKGTVAINHICTPKNFMIPWFIIFILGSRHTPVTGQKVNTLRFLPLNNDYSIYPECNKFVTTKMNVLNLSHGFENVTLVSFYFLKENNPIH